MSGFRFPPPPPPPPPAAAPPSTCSEQRGRGRGRGGGGSRGRRGRGCFYGNTGQQANPPSNGTMQRGQDAYRNHDAGRSQPLQNVPNDYTMQQSAYLAPGTHINPAFGQGHRLRATSAMNYSYQPNAPPAYSQHPVQSHGHGDNYQHLIRSHEHGDNYQHLIQSHGHGGHYQRGGFNARGTPFSASTRTPEGHKRKLDALRGPQPRKHQTTNPPSAPSVPGFGAPLILQQSNSSENNAQRMQNSRPAKRTLGLIPGDTDPTYSSSSESDQDDEDVDEENMYRALGQGITFEHNGSILMLNNVADLKEWINERKQNFPTRSRLPEKEEKRRRVGAERIRLLAKAQEALRERLSRKKTTGEPNDQSRRRESEMSKLKNSPNKKARRLSQLEAQEGDTRTNDGQSRRADEPADPDSAAPQDPASPRSEVSTLSALNTASNGAAQHATGEPTSHISAPRLEAVPATAPIETNDASTQHPASTAGIEEDVGDTVERAAAEPLVVEDENLSSVDSCDEEPPETTTTKPPPLATTKKTLCKYFSCTGRCRQGDACLFRHELLPRAREALKREAEAKAARRRDPYAPVLDEPDKGPRLTIHQRLLEQEQEEEEKLAVQVIRYLGRMGLFGRAASEAA